MSCRAEVAPASSSLLWLSGDLSLALALHQPPPLFSLDFRNNQITTHQSFKYNNCWMVFAYWTSIVQRTLHHSSLKGCFHWHHARGLAFNITNRKPASSAASFHPDIAEVNMTVAISVIDNNRLGLLTWFWAQSGWWGWRKAAGWVTAARAGWEDRGADRTPAASRWSHTRTKPGSDPSPTEPVGGQRGLHSV